MKETKVRSRQMLSGAIKEGETVVSMATPSLATDKPGDISLRLTNNHKALPNLNSL